jgi:PiT family inorganic phosphate transporter
MVAWIITIPASATVAALFYLIAAGYVGRALATAAVIALVGFAAFAWRELKLQRSASGRLSAAIAVIGFLAAAAVVLYGLWS